ncbi:DUF624 domain-containing protein [Clostridiaceae bacterium]|nr:DUF624 domain-containing protein [Clostridiaceae bacterium]
MELPPLRSIPFPRYTAEKEAVMRIDSPVIAAGMRMTNLLILNLFWLIGCLPLVTIGVSTIAAYTVTLKMVEDCEDYSMTAQFWKAYVKNLKHGIPLSLVLLAACGSILMDVRMVEAHTGDTTGLLTAGFLLLLLLLIHFLYLFPLEARYQNRLMAGVANARGIFLSYPRRSLILTGILLAEFLLVTQLNTPLRSFSPFFLPILMIYTVSKAVHPVFRELEQLSGKGGA